MTFENWFSCGPFTLGTEATLRQMLATLGLRLSDDDLPPRCTRDPAGDLRLEAKGSGVRGYFLAEDGEEAELQDVRRLVLMGCLPGRDVTFEGSAVIAKETLLVVTSRASHDGKRVTWTSTRTVLGPSKVAILRDRIG